MTPLFQSKLPQTGLTIFSKMSALAEKYGAINLSQGFPNFEAAPDLIEKVDFYMKRGLNQYAPMAGVVALRQRLAEKMAHLYGADIDPETDITVTAGGTQALFSAINAFVQPQDEVIIIEPAYDSYAPAVTLAGGIVRVYTMAPPQYPIDWTAFGALISSKTRLIIINSPHNPTGTVLTGADLEALWALVENTNILVLSDEVYEHLIFDGRPHCSVLGHNGLRQRSLACFSFGKTFHVTGWKLGYIVAPAVLMAEFRKVHQFTVFAVNTPMQYALADYLADAAHYDGLPAFYQNKRDKLAHLLLKSRFKPLESHGTYFQIFDYQDISTESDLIFCEKLVAEHGVAAIPVSAFYTQNQPEKTATLIRLCFAKTDDTLVAAAKRLCLV